MIFHQQPNIISDPISELLFEENPAGLIAADSRGTILRVNRAFCQLFNCPKELCLLFSWQDLLGISNSAIPKEFLNLRRGKTKELNFEKKILINNSSPIWIRISIKKVHLPAANDFYFLAAVLNITESKKREDSHRRSELLFKNTENIKSQVIWEWNRTTNQMSWNNDIEKFGYYRDEIHSDVFWWIERIHKDDRERILFEIEKAIELKKEIWKSEYRFLKADGQYAIVSDCAFIDYDKKMKAIHITGSKVDITEKKNNETELLKAKSDALLAARVKSEFIANMSHEIRTPLSAILGFTDFLMDPNLSTQEKHNYVQTIKRNSSHLYQLVNEILDLSKLEAGQFEFERICFPLNDVITAVTSAMKFKAEERGIEFKVTSCKKIPQFIKTDPTRLQQILSHLVGNAIKFTEHGSVEVFFDFEPGILPTDEGILKCRIQDTGIGLSNEDQRKIFKSFSQADASTTRKFGGAGLGLSISRKIAKSMGGDVQLVNSEVGRGSVFELSIQAGTSYDTESSNSGLGNSGIEDSKLLNPKFDFTGLKILLVDDSPDNRILLSRILTRKGAQVVTADNGFEGKQRALEDNYNLVLMDVQMPVMGGFEATRLLRESGYQKPIIAFTAHSTKQDREASLMAGFDDHLTKPVNQSALFNMINYYGVQAEPPVFH